MDTLITIKKLWTFSLKNYKIYEGEVFFIKYLGFIMIAVLVFAVTNNFQEIYNFSSIWLFFVNVFLLSYFAFLVVFPLSDEQDQKATN
ncbi:hypothetical protein SAMN05216243_0417 [Sediminibacillus albus]|uniref:Uncharacterized protein n=1 Tax=Sediminibacillus albus TaxID=407036 RepID=A0A1G8VXR5_9BACI|nr:hypothetical protein SAMN05216243_0417 [Sediminibacillus albus]